MGSLIWMAVKRYWALLLFLLFATLGGAVIGSAITEHEFNAAQTKSAKALSDKSAELAELKITYANEKRVLAEKQSQALAGALAKQQEYNQKANQLSGELLKAQQELSQTQQKLKRSIANATQHDGSTYTGLGPDSLRLYQTALGYTSSDQCVSDTQRGNAGNTSETSCTGSGLPPEDLLSHASDYGQWCQQLEAKLKTLSEFYQQTGSQQ